MSADKDEAWRSKERADSVRDARPTTLTGEATRPRYCALQLAGMQATTPTRARFRRWIFVRAADAGHHRLVGIGTRGELVRRRRADSRWDATAAGELKSMTHRPAPPPQRRRRRVTGTPRSTEQRAGARYRRLSLETGRGPAFEPALALYRSRGFTSGGRVRRLRAQRLATEFMHLTLLRPRDRRHNRADTMGERGCSSKRSPPSVTCRPASTWRVTWPSWTTDGFTVIEDYLSAGSDSSGSAMGWRPIWAPTAAAIRSRASPPSGSTPWSAAARCSRRAPPTRGCWPSSTGCCAPNYLLSANHAICIYPGEKAQGLHFDDSFYPFPRPRPAISISTIGAIDAFTPREWRHGDVPRQPQVDGRAGAGAADGAGRRRDHATTPAPSTT